MTTDISLLTTHYSLLTAHYSLLTTHTTPNQVRHHRRAQRLLKAVGHVASFDSIRTEAAAIMQRLTQALKVQLDDCALLLHPLPQPLPHPLGAARRPSCPRPAIYPPRCSSTTLPWRPPSWAAAPDSCSSSTATR